MKSNDIGVNVHYIPIYHFSYYQNNFNFDPNDFPVTEDVFNRIITLPLHPQLKEDQIEFICNKIELFTE
ncbi:amino-sugar biosynthesis protein [Methanobacterium formicicum DSM 3637]|uniref:Amino-sugar biosynthesis protein n=2 Tax=Methanobacterium formicicum TaxID=2162 RepID=K2R0G8_METFP|nr:amino-sugar biosynthesis protein [Methanobacterium formicicum DSM 3637]